LVQPEIRGQTWRLDDIPVGYVHRCGDVLVSAEDIAVFESRFGAALTKPNDIPSAPAPEGLVFSVWARLVREETSAWPVLAHLGQDALRWAMPVIAGDRLSLRMTMTAKDATAPDRGILFAQHELLNQRSELVLSLMTRTLLARRPSR